MRNSSIHDKVERANKNIPDPAASINWASY